MQVVSHLLFQQTRIMAEELEMYDNPVFVLEPAPHTEGDQAQDPVEVPAVGAQVAVVDPVGGAGESTAVQGGDWRGQLWAAAALLLAFAILSHA